MCSLLWTSCCIISHSSNLFFFFHLGVETEIYPMAGQTDPHVSLFSPEEVLLLFPLCLYLFLRSAVI